MELNTYVLSALYQVAKIKREVDISSVALGERFNVFRILGLSSNEVRTHSAFIAELLNPVGSHGQGSLYLRLFIDVVGISTSEFDSSSARVAVEVNIGQIDALNLTGGRIDIRLRDASGNNIFIENKVYASDVENQLLRYHNFDKQAKLLYLTLFGSPPGALSKGKCDFHVECISYRDAILEWLNLCYIQSTKMPLICATICQYATLIKQLTGVTEGERLMKEAKNVLMANPAIVDSIVILYDAWNQIVKEVKNKYTQLLKSSVEQCYVIHGGVYEIRVYADEDGDGQFVGFGLVDKRTNRRVAKDAYMNCMRGIVEVHHSNQHNTIGWFNPAPFKRGDRFESLPRADILRYYKDSNALETFVTSIKDQVDKIVNELLRLVEP